MQIYECKLGNLPEDIITNFEDRMCFVIGDNKEAIVQNVTFFPIQQHRIAYRKQTGKRDQYSWCGEHPRFWRELTETEKSDYQKWCKNVFKNLGKKTTISIRKR